MVKRFIQGISWRPVASYFFMLLLFGTMLKLYAVEKINIAVAVVVFLIFSAGLAWLLYHRVIKPLNEITLAAQEIARGNFDRQINISSPDEIGDLARSINNMAARLRSTIDEITEEKNRVQTILNSMGDCVMAVDGEGYIIMVNPVVETLFGMSQAECMGINILEVVRNYDLDHLLKRVQACQKPLTREIKILTPELRIFYLHVAPLHGSGQGGGAVVIMRDITERRNMEQMRSEFVANVSHELRTPLTSIRGFVETLLESGTDDPEMNKHFLEIIADETRRLSNLVEELLNLSKIEERRVVHRWRQVTIGELMDRALAVCGERAEAKQIAVKANIPARLPPFYGDPDMLAQVLINLMDNAIKYTPAGGSVTVSTSLYGDELRLDVVDTGAGIAAESLPRIFERFYRVEKARSREWGGTGLGLAIVKHIIKGHGGRIEVKSAVGKGTTFSVFLPMDSPENS
ncbi:two-component system histidine kinase PnpS [Desulfallas thermosapovorans]|uniref:histidine kinase n=1 Tax=Desulfallas thermosapovorans DSM 6562 TaxID=1121431 RepID=A0A5S4ZT70_9FIRM|nr:HAMP domain-containing sensor histidine kinase [Desulfallas thermosapovorans]TYO95884.1 PAS/PAC sensor signal transduction histidine kinase [Desulfallas thermosapovorans DSM 6562]